MLKKALKYTSVVFIALGVIYFTGPTPSEFEMTKSLPIVPEGTIQVETYLNEKEAQLDTKLDNEARIVWANDSVKQKTKYAIVYLHGFSASHGEGYPSHLKLAKSLHANLLLARLNEHGLAGEDALLNYSSTGVVQSAAEALAIGKQLGDSVILIGTSTGGTCALALASQFNEDIASILLFSPNIRVADERSFLLNNPWGLQITRMVYGSNFQEYDGDSVTQQYWNTKYRLEAITEMQELLESSMNKETFEKITCPVFLAYYYKNEQEQDDVVSVEAMLTMFDELGSEDKVSQAFPNAGDHVIASSYKSNDHQGVFEAAEKFLVQRFQ